LFLFFCGGEKALGVFYFVAGVTFIIVFLVLLIFDISAIN